MSRRFSQPTDQTGGHIEPSREGSGPSHGEWLDWQLEVRSRWPALPRARRPVLRVPVRCRVGLCPREAGAAG